MERRAKLWKWDGSLSCRLLFRDCGYPVRNPSAIKRVAILFAGGPAPAANAVISTAAASFRRHGIEVLGILHGYSHLVEYR